MERSTVYLLLAIYCLACMPGNILLAQPTANRSSSDVSSADVSSIAELISTPRRSTAAKRQIRIRGTVSVVGGMLGDIETNPKDKSFCVEDESAGIWIRVKQAVDRNLLEDTAVLSELQAGVEVEIEGSLHPGGFAPAVLPRKITLLGKGELSQGIRPNLKDFFRGACIMRRVTVTGVVQNMTDDPPGWLARVETGAGHFLTRLPSSADFSPKKVMDAEIQVTGVAGASRNWRSQFICPRVMIAKAEDVKILQAPSENPFEAERVRVDELDSFNVKGRSLHRRCIQGKVTYYDGDKTLYLLNEDLGVRLELNQPANDIRLGDWVKASGFIDSTRYLRGLRGARVQAIGKRNEAAPVETTVRKIIDDHFNVPTWKQEHTKTYDGRVVMIRGEVKGVYSTTERSKTKSRIDLDCYGMKFTATIHEPLEELLPGTTVDLTGIASISYARSDLTSFLANPTGVELLLRSLADVHVISKPSWWTEPRIRAALAFAVFVAGLAVAWAVTLNRRVAKQTHQLAREMGSRRDAAIEFKAAIRERTQLAANIHDTVLQTLAGIGCQLDACQQSSPPDSEALTYLNTASRMVQGGQEDLRNVVSALHCLPLADQGFGESVKGVVERLQRTGSLNRNKLESRNGEDLSRLGWNKEDQTSITVHCADNLPKLADFIAGNLLLIIQEATRNAIKHSGARSISLSVDAAHGSRILITIQDDGCGFDSETRPRPSDGHFGLETMKGRAERIGGTLTVESEPGKGTVVRATVPLRSFDEAIT